MLPNGPIAGRGADEQRRSDKHRPPRSPGSPVNSMRRQMRTAPPPTTPEDNSLSARRARHAVAKPSARFPNKKPTGSKVERGGRGQIGLTAWQTSL